MLKILSIFIKIIKKMRKSDLLNNFFNFKNRLDRESLK